MADPAVVAERLGKRFGQGTALDGVDLVLPTGRMPELLGPNGAAKTTLLRITATLLKPDRGRARRRLVGLSGQAPATDRFLTGVENLVMIGRLCGLCRHAARRRAAELTGQLGLAGAAGRLARAYSGGMCRRLDVAASLLAVTIAADFAGYRHAAST